ncbi:MAG TPA: ABC transporter permease [Bacteroidota bacterium]|nr:ABC transporter permease [Bacteroidota bacterium]
MRLRLHLMIAALKMFARQREAILWSILLPLFMIFLFSFVNFEGLGTVTLGVVNNSQDTVLISQLRAIKTLKLVPGTEADELVQLKKGERSLVLVLPPAFQPWNQDSITLYLNANKPVETQAGKIMIQRVLDELVLRKNAIPRPVIRTESMNTLNLSYLDFLLPGILAMSIMQGGIFGVAFSFVLLKKRGILRRMLVTPMSPADFIYSQVAMRLVVLMGQIAIMVYAGMWVFKIHFVGSLLNMLVVGILGGIIFLAIGFALSGISKSEDQVAPLANIITLPMLFLSGVFFSRSSLPGFAHTITAFFPLTYLTDGLRLISTEGASLTAIWPQIAGLLVWVVITVFLAVKAFRWE